MESIEKDYLTPPDNEAIPVLKCFFCEEDLCESEYLSEIEIEKLRAK